MKASFAFAYRNGEAIQLLYALRNKEQYEKKGLYAFVFKGVITHGRYEVFVTGERPKPAPKPGKLDLSAFEF